MPAPRLVLAHDVIIKAVAGRDVGVDHRVLPGDQLVEQADPEFEHVGLDFGAGRFVARAGAVTGDVERDQIGERAADDVGVDPGEKRFDLIAEVPAPRR